MIGKITKEALREEFTRELTKTQRELFDAFTSGDLVVCARKPGRRWIMEQARKFEAALRGEGDDQGR